MKVLFLISSFGTGGAEKVASALSNAWVEKGYEVTLMPTFSGKTSKAYRLNPKVNFLCLNDLVRPNQKGAISKRYLERWRKLRNFIRSEKPDVVVSFLPNVNVAAIIATALTRVPVIICERSDPLMTPLGRFWKFACRVTYRRAELLIVQTHSVASTIGTVYPKLPRKVVIPNPVEDSLWEYQANLRQSRKRKIMLSVGRLAPEKQIAEIVTVFATLAEKHGDWDFHVYGSGQEEQTIREAINCNNLGDRVFLMGPTDKPWQVMQNADLFVMNSEFEGFPNAMLEAMAVGLPVVASNCNSGPDELTESGKYGLLFQPGNMQEFARALRKMMEDEAFRITMSESARKSIREKYQMASILEMWDRAFDDVLISKGSSTRQRKIR